MTSRLLCSSVIVLFSILSGCADRPIDVSTRPATPAVFNAAQAPTIGFSLPDMMCEDGCAAAVKDILAHQSGVKDVQVDFDAKMATVAVDEDAFDSQQALAALVDKGFDNSALVEKASESAAEPHATAASDDL